MTTILLVAALTGALVAVGLFAVELHRLQGAIDHALSALAASDVCLCGERVSDGQHGHIIVTGTDVAVDVLRDAARWNTRAGSTR